MKIFLGQNMQIFGHISVSKSMEIKEHILQPTSIYFIQILRGIFTLRLNCQAGPNKETTNTYHVFNISFINFALILKSHLHCSNIALILDDVSYINILFASNIHQDN